MTLKCLLDKAISTNKLVDKQIFHGAFFSKSYRWVYTVVKNKFPNDVEDLVMDAYALLFSIHLVRLKSIKNLESYTLTIALNCGKDLIKRRKRKEEAFHALFSDIDFELSSSKINKEFLVAKLNEKNSQILILRFYDDLTYFQIMEILQLPSEGSARKRVSRALRELKKLL